MPRVRRWTVGDVVIDLETRELLRGGTPVPLSPKAFQLLGILVASAPKALSKSELQDRLWPGTFVVEKNLTNLVAEIRQALGDDAARPRFIRTVSRFGYAFREGAAETREDISAGRDESILAAERRRHNLPEPLTSFVGRGRELAELSQALASTRLLTLTGTGGCGKTRLALKLARHLLDRFRDGVWLVDLAPVLEPGLVAQTVASVLDVRQQPNRSLGDALAAHLRRRQVLLVLDNCEHLVGPCAGLAEALLQAASDLTILTTSREALGIGGETIWRVPPLTLPDSPDAARETLAEHEAIRLFLERAVAVEPTFMLADDNAAAVAAVCQRLDGIPLAIELAAARLNVLTIEEICGRLDDRFRLLTGGSRTALARQRTLEATVDWSYDLLTGRERRLLQRLSVFAGGWTVNASEEVCQGGEIERSDVLDLLSHLADKSLVILRDKTGGRRRYDLLETVRQYAREHLLRSGQVECVRNRHLEVFLDFARRAEPELTTLAQVSWLKELQLEHDNVRAALEWGVAAPRADHAGLQLAAALWRLWLKRGAFAEGQQWLERALNVEANPPAALRAKALLGLGTLIFFQGDFVGARVRLAESAALGRAKGDLSLTAFALGLEAIAAMQLGHLSEAAPLAAEARSVGRASDAPWMQGPALSCLAYKALYEGNLDEAGRLHEEELDLLRRQGETWATTIVMYDLALLRVVQQRHAEARALCRDGLDLSEAFGDRRGIAWYLGVLAGADAAEGRAIRAARLQGAMHGLLQSAGAPVQPVYKTWIGDRYFDDVQRTLGGDAYRKALADGRAMSLAESLRYALEGQQ